MGAVGEVGVGGGRRRKEEQRRQERPTGRGERKGREVWRDGGEEVTIEGIVKAEKRGMMTDGETVKEVKRERMSGKWKVGAGNELEVQAAVEEVKLEEEEVEEI